MKTEDLRGNNIINSQDVMTRIEDLKLSLDCPKDERDDNEVDELEALKELAEAGSEFPN